MSIHIILGDLTTSIATLLSKYLPEIEKDWWNNCVVNKLSFQQQRLITDKKVQSIEDLDLAGLLRIFDQNWHSLGYQIKLDQQTRNWLKEAQGIRNRWAHLPPGGLKPEDAYRDADTLCRLLSSLPIDQSITQNAEIERARLLEDLSPTKKTNQGSTNYAKENSSITLGSVVRLKTRPEITGAVLEIQEGVPENRLKVFHDGQVTTYYESQLELHIVVQERLNIDEAALHSALTSIQLRHPSMGLLYSLHASRINFVPYQFRPVMKLIQADRPRILIADEVGVGKTIEAGLILKELQARREIKSVLIICPKPLIAERKWQEELKRFDEQFIHLDGDALRYCIEETHLDGVWPQQFARSIIPYSLFDETLLLGKQGKGRSYRGLLDLDPPPTFDLVIVDEAHHIRNTDTWAYRTVRYFCDNAEAVVLMSATPIQLGDSDLFNLLQLVRPDLLPSRRDFDHMAEPNRFINDAIEIARNAKQEWIPETRSKLMHALNTNWGLNVLSANPKVQLILDKLNLNDLDISERLTVIRELESFYTFAPIINRTRRRDIGNFTTRKPETVSVDFTSEQKLLHQGVLDFVEKILAYKHGDQNLAFMMSTIKRQVASCVFGLAPYLKNLLSGQINKIEMSESDIEAESDSLTIILSEFRTDLDALVHIATNLSTEDPKFAAFLKVVVNKQVRPNNKLLVFSTFRHTLAYLDLKLSETNIRIGLIHGDVPEEKRRELRNRFSRPKDDPRAIDLLLSSEVGCEGLDFQFCDGIVNYDLPWNPMRVEQRIGRIDRYGQKSETVAIYNFITPGTVDAEIYERCLLRIGVFRQSLGGSEEILGKLTKEIHDIAENLTLTFVERNQRLQQLADNEIRVVQEQMILEEQQASLFGLTVPKQDEELIKNASSFWLTPQKICNLIERYFEFIDLSKSYKIQSKQSIVNVQLKQEIRNKLIEDYKEVAQIGATDKAWDRWLKGSDPYLRITFDPISAAEDRSVTFITPTHPLARQAARAIQPTSKLTCTLATKTSNIKPGRYPFAIYRWRVMGVNESFVFKPICQSEDHSQLMLELLENSTEDRNTLPITSDEEEKLENLHYKTWITQRSLHIENVTQSAEIKINSLRSSHDARIALLEEQRNNATDARIRRMKDGQIESANRDYERRLSGLKLVKSQAEIISESTVFGILQVS